MFSTKLGPTTTAAGNTVPASGSVTGTQFGNAAAITKAKSHKQEQHGDPEKGESNKPNQETPTSQEAHEKGKYKWGFEVMFSWLLILAILELGFTVDTIQYQTRKHQWSSKSQRRIMSYLLFSSLRSVILAAVYIGSHIANKWFKSLHHTIFLVLNTIFWIVGGVLVKHILGVVECGGVGRLQGGLSECHELKIIEILAWITAASSILICIPVVYGALKRQKHKAERGETEPQKKGWGLWMQRLALKKSSKKGTVAGSDGKGLMNEKAGMGRSSMAGGGSTTGGSVNNV